MVWGVDRESFFSLHQELVDGRDIGLDGAVEGGEEGIIKAAGCSLQQRT